MKKVTIVGCGGLGGYVIEQLSRTNVGKIVLIDGDKFDESNNNRQLACLKETFGLYKVDVYKERILSASKCEVETHKEFLTKDNISLLEGSDVVIDCLDNVPDRFLIHEYCSKHNIAMVHGAVKDRQGQACLVLPNQKILSKLYDKEIYNEPHYSVHAIAVVASIQALITKKYLSGDYQDLLCKLFVVDLDEISIKKLTI